MMSFERMWRRCRVRLLLQALLACASLSAFSQQAPIAASSVAREDFLLRLNDQVVFYGDSITEQRFYTWWTEVYVTTRFPQLHVRFTQAGVGGDRVSGGSGGTIDERLRRDVFPWHPNWVTIMLGMNDGSYGPLTPKIEEDYSKGYEHILQSLQANLPGVRIVSIGASPYDSVTRSDQSGIPHYNDTLLHFGEIGKRLASQYGALFADANRSFTVALGRAMAQDPFASRLLIPDRVHPDSAAHMVIALALLHAWKAPALVSSTVIDAASLRADPSQYVRIHGLQREKDSAQGADAIHWFSLEDGLPMPLGWASASLEYMKQYTDCVRQINQEPMRVTGLRSGRYSLTIDDQHVGDFTAEELNDGINLAEMNTPMRRQSESIEWKMRDKGDLQFVRMRVDIDGDTPEAHAALNKAEENMRRKIWAAAVPTEHRFLLSRLAEKNTAAQ